MAKHMRFGGCGIRSFVDIWIFQSEFPRAEEKKNKKPETIEILEIVELYSYLYDFKKNKRFMSKYGLLWIEEKIKF